MLVLLDEKTPAYNVSFTEGIAKTIHKMNSFYLFKYNDDSSGHFYLGTIDGIEIFWLPYQ